MPQEAHMANEKNQPKQLPPEYRGTKTYRLGARHYRKGVLYEAGELITVTDEIPSKTWTLVDTSKPEEKPAPAGPKQSTKRDADTAI
jgi:hypothetical protein